MRTQKFILVPLDRRLAFEQKREENKDIIPCSVYINKESKEIYFVEEPSALPGGEILDCGIEDATINDGVPF